MRFPLVCFLSLAMSLPLLAAENTAPKYPPHTIGNSELRVLPKSAITGRDYQLHVRVPASFAENPHRKYPVLFVTDGYWDFATIVTSYDNLIYDKVVPELVIVGLGYAGENVNYGRQRSWELSPARLGPQADGTGHADKFLEAVEKEIIPFIEREYRGDPNHRVLAGSSLGGLFTLYAMFTKPELFKGYIAASPATGAGRDWLFDYEEKFSKSGRRLEARLYMTGAENEWAGFLGAIKRFNERLAARKYPGLDYEWRLIDGERHAGTKAESYVRGMRFVFAPVAPESGPMR